MKKTYFKDINTEDKIKIIFKNKKLEYKVYEMYYEYAMNMQLEEGNLMLGDSRNNGIDIRDNYSSFYLVLTDWSKFLDNLDKDYLCQEGLDLYDKIMELKKEWDNTDFTEEEDRCYELEEEIEEKCKELLKICENQLHQYENYTEEDVKDWLSFELEENGLFDDYYILGGYIDKVYNDVRYTETFE